MRRPPPCPAHGARKGTSAGNDVPSSVAAITTAAPSLPRHGRLRQSTVKSAVLSVTAFLLGCALCATVLVAREHHRRVDPATRHELGASLAEGEAYGEALDRSDGQSRHPAVTATGSGFGPDRGQSGGVRTGDGGLAKAAALDVSRRQTRRVATGEGASLAETSVPSRPLHPEASDAVTDGGTRRRHHHLRQIAVEPPAGGVGEVPPSSSYQSSAYSTSTAQSAPYSRSSPPSLPRYYHSSSFDVATKAGGAVDRPQSILSGVRVLVAIASYDMSQIPHLEEVLDSYHDLCAAGSYVDVVVHTTVPYPVALIDLLNTRLSCVDSGWSPSRKSRLSVTVVLKNPGLRLNLVDCHRELFYERIDEYDLFIYTEDDIRVTPKTVAAYLSETGRVLQLLGGDTLAASDFNVGIVRYEYNYPPDVVIDDKTRGATENVTRVYWEHGGKPILSNAVHAVPNAPALEGEYVGMTNHHQGMFLATKELLVAWKDRPNCRFDVVRQRPGMKNKPSQPSEGTQRVWMSSQMLYGGRHCNVRQVLPIDRFGALTVLHLPNKNYRRVGKKGRLGGYKEGAKEVQFADGTETFEGADPGLLSAMQLHLALRKEFPRKPREKYRGIDMVDEIDRGMFVKNKREYLEEVDRRMSAFNDYVARGGVMVDADMDDCRW